MAVSVTALTACGTPGSSSDGESDRSTAPVSEIDWTPCGPIECGQIEVPVEHSGQQLSGDGFDPPMVKVAVFRRKSNEKKAPTVVLLPDRRFGRNARALVENAPLEFGARSGSFTLVSIAPRGSFDSPMPTGHESNVSTRDQVDDLEALRANLGAKKLSAIGWGTGATVGATWAMSHPGRVSHLVLDSPMDPSVTLGTLARRQVESVRSAVNTAFLFCASHLACPMNANLAKFVNAFKLSLRLGRIPEGADLETIARAGTTALANGDALLLFRAVGAAMDGDPTTLLALAGTVPTSEDARPWCADAGRRAAARVSTIFRDYREARTRQFSIGSEADVYARCAELPETLRPLWGTKPDPGAKGLAVHVTIARGDPVVPPWAARTMAKKMDWSYRSVHANRHLVVGFDPAATDAAFEFLSSNR